MKNLLALSLFAAVPLVSIAQVGNISLYGRINYAENWETQGSFATKAAINQGASSVGKTHHVFYSQTVGGAASEVQIHDGLLAQPPSWRLSVQSRKRVESYVGNGDTWIAGVTLDYNQPGSFAEFVAGSTVTQQVALFQTQRPTSGTPQVNYHMKLRRAVAYGRPWMDVVALNGNNVANNTFVPEVWFLQYRPEMAQLERTYAFNPLSPGEVARGFGQLDVAGWNGSKVAVGFRFGPSESESMCLTMLELIGEANAVAEDDPPPTVTLDTTFGVNGRVVIRHPDPTQSLRYFQHVFDPEERVLVVYGAGRPGNTFVPTLLRLRKDGTPDPSFGTNGTVVIPTTGATTNARTVTVDIHGNIVVTGETYTATTVRPFIYFHYKTSPPGAPETYGAKLVEHAIPGKENSTFFNHIREPDGTITAVGATFGAYPNTATMRPLVVQMDGPVGALKAIEYFHANFAHFATIVNPAEAAKLDSGEISGWARTNRFFWVYPLGTAHTLDVDRFFSTSFAKSSHVYTANAAESAALKQNRDWLFEGTVFGAILPLMGKCPGVLRPVTRIYNNGVTGSPNHQFTDNPQAVVDAVGRDGTVEGEGPSAAVYCTE